MGIHVQSPRAKRIIYVLNQLPIIPDSVDLPTETLTGEDITDIKRHLEKKNPGLARFIRDSHRQLPRDHKFSVRNILFDILCALVESTKLRPKFKKV